MPRRSPILLALGACLALASPAAAYTYGDTLTLVWKPLPNLPSIVRPGDNLTVWANAPSGASGWSGSLRLGLLQYALPAPSGGWQSSLGRWVLQFSIPPGVPDELYDLSLTCTSCTADIAPHAVKVLPSFKSDFYFAQISDTHLPSHAFSSDQGFSTADTTGMADFDAVIDDLNLIRPEFVLHSGDIVNEGELEEYLGMYEMGRALEMLSRLRDPIFVASGNHDVGGWQPTPPPAGTSRKNWWRYFGWPFLLTPPAGDPYHSQDFSFDYGSLHVVGLEAYLNNGQYDGYRTDLWGPQSFTTEQMNWLTANLAAVPPGVLKLAFYHYDFGGSSGNPQINPAALGLNGAIWGHNHGVAEGAMGARPFNLGLRSVIDRRSFRIFRVSNGAITPGPMHQSGGTSFVPVDSLTVAWSGPNNGTRSSLTATVTNRFKETWDRSRLVFYLVDHDSIFAASGGTVAQTVKQGGIAAVYVDCVLPAQGTAVVSVVATAPAGVTDAPATRLLSLEPTRPNPFRPEQGPLAVRFSTSVAGPVRLAVYDLAGRRIAVLFDGPCEPGAHVSSWNGRSDGGAALEPGAYLLRLQGPGGEQRRKLALVR